VRTGPTPSACSRRAQAACRAGPTVDAFQAAPPALRSPLSVDPRLLALAAGLVLLALAVKRLLDTPSRAYNPDAPNVGDEYDSWTQCAPAAPARRRPRASLELRLARARAAEPLGDGCAAARACSIVGAVSVCLGPSGFLSLPAQARQQCAARAWCGHAVHLEWSRRAPVHAGMRALAPRALVYTG